MATYKTTYVLQEPGLDSETFDIVMVSDTFVGLLDVAAATEVNVLDHDVTEEGLDRESGTTLISNMSFALLETKAETSSDYSCINLVLSAEDPDTFVYAARVIVQDGTVPTIDHFAFRGRVDTDISAEDIRWNDGEFGDNPVPLRDWSCTAKVIDIGSILDEKVKDTVDRFRFGEWLNPDSGNIEINYGAELTAVYETWYEAEVADRQAYFRGYGNFPESGQYRAVYFGKLLTLGAALTAIVDNLNPAAGITYTFAGGVHDLILHQARWNPIRLPRTIKVSGGGGLGGGGDTYEVREVAYRYVTGHDADPLIYTKIGTPFEHDTDDAAYLRTDGLEGIGGTYISFYLLLPINGDDDPDAPYSWRELTVAQLLSRLAYSFGAVVDVTYTAFDAATISLTPRGSVGTTAFYLRDVTSAKLDLKAVEGEAQRFVGVANRFCFEGANRYTAKDGYFEPKSEKDRPNPESPLLPLTISPTYVWYDWQVGEEMGVEFRQYPHERPHLPHNAIFYSAPDDETELIPQGDASRGEIRATTEGLHTALYVCLHGDASETIIFDDNNTGKTRTITQFEEGVNGLPIWSPVSIARVKIDGKDKFIERLSEYTEETGNRDKRYYEGAYTMTVPGLNQFRATPGGALSWRNVRAGYVLTLDGVQWICEKVRRKRTDTELTFSHISKFSGYATPAGATTEVPPAQRSSFGSLPSTSDPASLPGMQRQLHPAGDFSAWMLVSELTEGQATVAEATEEHYERVRGISLNPYDVELSGPNETVAVITRGDISLPEDLVSELGLSPGDRLYLRTPYGGSVNWSNVPVDGRDPAENLFYEFGYVKADGMTIKIDPKPYTVLL